MKAKILKVSKEGLFGSYYEIVAIRNEFGFQVRFKDGQDPSDKKLLSKVAKVIFRTFDYLEYHRLESGIREVEVALDIQDRQTKYGVATVLVDGRVLLVGDKEEELELVEELAPVYEVTFCGRRELRPTMADVAEVQRLFPDTTYKEVVL